MNKPTGKIGPFSITIQPSGKIEGKFESVTFSPQKAEVELEIVKGFINSIEKRPIKGIKDLQFSEPKNNPENDFDISVNTSNGSANLELMEIAPLKEPYQNAPSSYDPYHFANTIMSGIRKKSDVYTSVSKTDLFLLIYTTHWAFSLSDSVVKCLQYWCTESTTVFKHIFSYEPLDENEGVVNLIYPTSLDQLKKFHPNLVKGIPVIHLNPSEFRIEQYSDNENSE